MPNFNRPKTCRITNIEAVLYRFSADNTTSFYAPPTPLINIRKKTGRVNVQMITSTIPVFEIQPKSQHRECGALLMRCTLKLQPGHQSLHDNIPKLFRNYLPAAFEWTSQE